MTKAQEIRFHATETASHETGHALVTIALCRVGSKVTILMTEGHATEGFVKSGNKYVHGFNVTAKLKACPLDVATIGYAGLLGSLLYYNVDANKGDDELFSFVDTLPVSEWSDADLEHIAAIPSNAKHIAFRNALMLLRGHRAALREYTDWIASSFVEAESEKEVYSINSLDFKPPHKDSL